MFAIIFALQRWKMVLLFHHSSVLVRDRMMKIANEMTQIVTRFFQSWQKTLIIEDKLIEWGLLLFYFNILRLNNESKTSFHFLSDHGTSGKPVTMVLIIVIWLFVFLLIVNTPPTQTNVLIFPKPERNYMYIPADDVLVFFQIVLGFTLMSCALFLNK